MAITFSVPDGGAVMTQPAPAGQGPRVTLDGAGRAPAPQATGGDFARAGQQAAHVSLKALQALNTMAQGALAPIIERQQQQAYANGVAQVAQGRALMDIEREQPWYTQIFGPSATVRGAQAMSAMVELANASTEVTRAMPELRKQGPEMMRQYLAEQMQGVYTGDAAVDALVQQKLMESWTTTLSTHMKQHMAWQQEQAGAQFLALQQAEGTRLQETLAQQEGFDHPDQMVWEVDKFKDGLAKPAGMLDAAYGSYMAQAAQGQLHAGNFAAYEAMKATPEVWGAIPPEARQQLVDSEPRWTQQARLHDPALVNIMTDAATFTMAVKAGGFGGDVPALHKAIDQINADFRAQHGATTPAIDNAQRGALIAAHLNARADAQGVYARAAQDEANDQAQWASFLLAYNTGDPSKMPPGVSEAIAYAASEFVWQQAQASPQTLDIALSKLAKVSWDSRMHPASLVRQLERDTAAFFNGAGEITDNQKASLALMQKLLTVPGGGPHALGAYIGEKAAAQVQSFLALAGDLNDDAALVHARQTAVAGAGAVVTQATIDDVERYLNKQDTGWFSQMWGGPGMLHGLELTHPAKRWMAQQLAPTVAQYQSANPGLPMDAVLAYAFKQTYGSPGQMDFVDGAPVPKNPRLPGAQSLYAGVQQAAGFAINPFDENYQRAVRETLRETLKADIARHAAPAPERAPLDAATAAFAAAYNIPLYPPQGDMGHFESGHYVAAHGEQLQGGVLAVTYLNTKTHQTKIVMITPQQVLTRLQRIITRKGDALEGSPLTEDKIRLY